MLKRLKSVSMVLFLMGTTGAAYAASYPGIADVQIAQQTETCTGIVVDANGETVIGASVVVKGTTNGTITGFDGDFSISNVKKGDVIQISFIGYVTQEIVWKGKPLNVTLKEDTKTLDEVVVVGFGTQKKSKVTGSVATLDSKTIAARPINSVVDAMQGSVPGLNFSVGGGGGQLDSPKTFNIRGVGSLGGSSTQPLVLIDGVEGDINALNPQDIETMSVLKDASTASIYGSRAAGGVVLITTKSGKEGKTVVNYNNSFRFNSPLNMPKMMDSWTWANYMNEASINSGYGAWFSDSKLEQIKKAQSDPTMQKMFINKDKNIWEVWDVPELLPIGNTDWLKEHFGGTHMSQEHNLSVSGGTEKYKVYLSANFLDQDGIMRHGKEGKQRYSMNAKLSAQVFKWLNVSYNARFTRENYDSPSIDKGLFYHNACRYWPILPTTDPNGHYVFESYISRLKEGGRWETETDNLTQQVAFRATPIKGWIINAELNYRITNYNQHQDWMPVYAYRPDNTSWVAENSVSSVSERASKDAYFNPNIFTEYSHDWNGHNMKVMVGFQAEKFKTRNIYAQRNNIIAGLPTIDTTGDDPRVGGAYNHWATAGFFGRLNYDWKGRYMAEVSMRYDGSSRFLKDDRWQLFPSFSVGWNIAREEFMEKYNGWLSTLTLRGSYGQLGNQNTVDQWGNQMFYPFFPSIGFNPNAGSWLLDGKKPNIAGQPRLVSTTLTWEKMATWEIGLDWALFNNRLSGTFGYFQRKTKDMVGPAPQLPGILGIDVPKTNNTELTSKGFDLQISWRDIIEDFSYGITFNLSDNKVVIDEYPNDSYSLDKYFNGRVYGDIYGYTTLGIAKTQEEMDAHLAKVDQSALGSNWGPGDVMYADLNGDGKINNGENTVDKMGDLKVIGNDQPRFNFGLNLDAAYKGFDLKLFFQGVLKRDYWASGNMFWGGSQNKWQASGFEPHMDYFRPADTDSPFGPNVNGYYPRVAWDGSGKNQQVQTRYLQNAAYCRLKNVTLGYTLPKELTHKFFVENLRLFVSAENLFTITSFSDMSDPELIDAGGWGFGKTYPLSKTVSFGLNVTF